MKENKWKTFSKKSINRSNTGKSRNNGRIMLFRDKHFLTKYRNKTWVNYIL